MSEKRSLYKWLEERGLSGLKQNFDSCGMDIVALKYMTPHELKEVVPATKMGLRIKMRVKMIKWQEQFAVQNSRWRNKILEQRKKFTTRASYSKKHKYDYSSSDSDTESESDSEGEELQSDMSDEMFFENIDKNIAEVTLDESNPLEPKTPKRGRKAKVEKTIPRELTIPNLSFVNVVDPKKLMNTDSQEKTITEESTPVKVVFQQTIVHHPKVANLTHDLSQILQETPKGRRILLYQQNHDSLSMTLRIQMIDTIVEYFLDKHFAMKTADFEILTQNIIAMFPQENPVLYFHHRRNGKHLTVSGKLFHKYHNKIRAYKKMKIEYK